MQSLLNSELGCSTVTTSSANLHRIQESLSHNLICRIENCGNQISGMKEYALSLHPLIEKLRTERSYMDILAEAELRSEQAINILKTNYLELDKSWELKYNELESSSTLRYNQHVVESREKYDALVESTNQAYADLRAVYEASRYNDHSLLFIFLDWKLLLSQNNWQKVF
jgi:hypothetical protein